MGKQHSGHIEQTLIYTGKLFRMFIFQGDWKVLPMAAIIAGLVTYVIGSTLFVTMRGTLVGTFALSCICIWNGCFNSIQSVCRERPIVKREHRAGLHMSSYIFAHMIYQAFVCLCQTLIVIALLLSFRVHLPAASHVTGNVVFDLGITMFLTAYASDMLALFVSSIVRNTTVAMTIMPFIMIFQLVFSGGFFSLTGAALKVTDFAVSKWGLNAMCAVGEYNTLPNDIVITAINNMDTSKIKINSDMAEKLEIDADDLSESVSDTLGELTGYLKEPEKKEALAKKFGEMSYVENYESEPDNIISCWLIIVFWTIIYAAAAVIALEFIDKDKR